MFEQLSSKSSRRSSRTLLVSFLIHLVVVATVLVLPLWFFQQLPAAEFVSYLTAPPPAPAPPPPPPAPAPQRLADAARTRVVSAGFTAPREIPSEIPEAPDHLPEISSSWLTSSTGGIPGGEVAAGLTAGAASGIRAASLVETSGPPPPPPAPIQTVRHGGDVQSARLIHRVDPEYPPLAKRARIQGLVLLQATVDEEGRINELRLVSGHPLLNEAALAAVRQWRYSPTLLNGEPVRVITTISVIFKLN